MLFSSCTHTLVKPSANFSGEEYFKGIFFVSGEFAKMIPQYADAIEATAKMTDKQKLEQEQFQNQLLEEIRTASPDFFARFEKAIKSGEHGQVNMILNEGGEKIYIALRKNPLFKKFFEKTDSDKSMKEDISNDKGEIDKTKLELALLPFHIILSKVK